MKHLFFTCSLLLSLLSVAQGSILEEFKKTSFSGSVDTYYQTYLSAPDDIGQSFGTAFDNETGFALGMANLIAKYEDTKAGVVADVVFGPRGNAAASEFNLNQLYAFWHVNKSTTLTIGRFNTYLGYEVISPVANFNYSTSYLFSNGPFSHLGLKANFELTKDLSLLLAFMNPTDVNHNLTGDYALGAQIGYAKQYLNVYWDNGAVLGFEIDYTGGIEINEVLYLGLNSAYQVSDKAGFYGAALYPQTTITKHCKLGLRSEYFAYHDTHETPLPHVFAFTLTGSFTADHLIIKPEVRLDSWKNDTPYFDSNNVAAHSLSGVTVAAIYSF